MPETWISETKIRFGSQLMVVGIISGSTSRPLGLIRVAPKVKINEKHYVQEVLKPLLDERTTGLYAGKEENVFIRHDTVKAHSAGLTQKYAVEIKECGGPELISNSEIPIKSPDASPMDFFSFG